MKAVNLRSATDSVYTQAPSDSCFAHAAVNALETMCDRAGMNLRFSRAGVHGNALDIAGRVGGQGGADGSHIMQALNERGILLESQWPWSRIGQVPPRDMPSALGKIVMLPMANPTLDNIKRKLCLGIPVMMGMAVHQGFLQFGGNNWRTHDWDTGVLTTMAHAVCIQGYEDDCTRLYVENSWGRNWGDNGFFGLPYDKLRAVGMGFWTIDDIEGVYNIPVEGYVSIPYLLDPRDSGDFFLANKERFKTDLVAAFGSGGAQAVIDYCVTWSITDKLLEHMFLWPRGNVEKFKDANPGLNWAGFKWAEK